ncbi:MAG: carotenoid biosynthesis protein [Lachnospirales bacterium]
MKHIFKRRFNMEKEERTIDYVKWGCLVLFAILTIASQIPGVPFILQVVQWFPLIAFAVIHGCQRYGWKNMLIYFVITWVVSNFLESLSIITGFPFGNYHYMDSWFKIVGVPIAIMPTYFAQSYIALTMAQALIGIFNKKINGIYKFIVPFTAALVMTMWDVISDPTASTITGGWTWENGGEFFGVPVSNFAGWVLCVYIFMQIFTLILSKYESTEKQTSVASNKSFWIEPCVAYACMGTGVLISGFTQTEYIEIYRSMAMLSVFLVLFNALMASMRIIQNKEDLR